jgi:hypothetical protein
MPLPPRRKPFGRLLWQASGLQCGDERRRQRFRGRDRANHQIALTPGHNADSWAAATRASGSRRPHAASAATSIMYPTLKPGLGRIALRPAFAASSVPPEGKISDPKPCMGTVDMPVERAQLHRTVAPFDRPLGLGCPSHQQRTNERTSVPRLSAFQPRCRDRTGIIAARNPRLWPHQGSQYRPRQSRRGAPTDPAARPGNAPALRLQRLVYSRISPYSSPSRTLPIRPRIAGVTTACLSPVKMSRRQRCSGFVA